MNADDDSLGVTDVERDRAVAALRERFAGGGLTHEQFEERLGAVFQAQSRAKLDELVPSAYGRSGGSLVQSSLRQTDLDSVERHLSSGERVEWVGHPDPRKHFTRSDRFLVPFSILWGGFAVFWETSVIASGANPFFVLWGIPFVLLGLYFTVGRFFYKASRKRRTTYAVTNRRVLSIVRGSRGEAVEATYLRAIPNIATSAGSDRHGDVEFGTASPFGMQYANTGMEFIGRGGLGGSGVAFYDIEDPRGVADLVEHLREQDS